MSYKLLFLFFTFPLLVIFVYGIGLSQVPDQPGPGGAVASLGDPATNDSSNLDWRFWRYEHLKSLDSWGDSDADSRDAVAVYIKEDVDVFYFRVDLLDLQSDARSDIYFAVDYKPGGNTALVKDRQEVASDLSWDLLVWLSEWGTQYAFDTAYVDHPTHIGHTASDSQLDFVQCSVSKDALTGWDGNPFKLQVIVTDSGSTAILDKTAPVSTDTVTGRAKLVLVFGNMFNAYGPHAISWYDGFALDSGRRHGEWRGHKYLYDALEKYELPLTTPDLRVDVLPGNEYLHISDRLRDLTQRGLLDALETLTYGHFMPWQPDDVDAQAISMARAYRERLDLPSSEIFYPYEAMLTVSDLETIKEAGYRAIYAHDRYGYWFGWIDDWRNASAIRERIESPKKIHMLNGMNVFFDTRIGNYQGFAWDPRWGTIDWGAYSEYETYAGTDRGLHLWWRRILLDMALDPDQEKYFTIGTDFLLTPMMYQDISEWNARWLANHPWIEVTTFSDLLNRNWAAVSHSDLPLSSDRSLEKYLPEGDIHYNAYFWQFYHGGISDGHSPLIPEGAKIEGYFDYIPYLRDGQPIPSGMKMGDYETPGTIVYETLHNLQTAPDNRLTRLAWLSYFISIGEQTFHAQTLYDGGETAFDDWGGQYLHPYAKFMANHVRQVNKIVAAAHWVVEVQRGLRTRDTQVLQQDIDLDGEDEYILQNDKVFTVFENDGGRMDYAFALDPAIGPMQLVGPSCQNHLLIQRDGNYEDGEAIGGGRFWDAAFQEEGYEHSLFDVSLTDESLTFTSRDSEITKTFTLEGNTISAHYLTKSVDGIHIGFGLAVNMENMYSRDWGDKIEKVSQAGMVGWSVTDGGYAVVSLKDTQLLTADSFKDSPVREEMKERESYEGYPQGHWFFFPYNTLTVMGKGEFDLSLCVSTGDKTSVEERPDGLGSPPSAFVLYQNYPNPFNPRTMIVYDLPQATSVTLTLYTITGQKLTVLVDAQQEAGHHTAVFDGSGFANGVYVYRLEAGSFVETRRMLLIR